MMRSTWYNNFSDLRATWDCGEREEEGIKHNSINKMKVFLEQRNTALVTCCCQSQPAERDKKPGQPTAGRKWWLKQKGGLSEFTSLLLYSQLSSERQ